MKQANAFIPAPNAAIQYMKPIEKKQFNPSNG